MVEIVARVYILKTEQGGRASPVFSGYRPNLCFDEIFTDCAVLLKDQERLSPGDEGTIILRLLHPENVRKYLKPNQQFSLNEGLRKIATGEILKVD